MLLFFPTPRANGRNLLAAPCDSGKWIVCRCAGCCVHSNTFKCQNVRCQCSLLYLAQIQPSLRCLLPCDLASLSDYVQPSWINRMREKYNFNPLILSLFVFINFHDQDTLIDACYGTDTIGNTCTLQNLISVTILLICIISILFKL